LVENGQTLTPYRLGSLGGRKGKGDHFNLDVVTNSQEEKCELKYAMQTHSKKGRAILDVIFLVKLSPL